ncbi:MAG: hypothetical protein WCH65_07460 [bacterium]
MPDSEIEKVEFFDTVPGDVTYPNVHPLVYQMGVAYTNRKKIVVSIQ